jgi:hypothetical protein
VQRRARGPVDGRRVWLDEVSEQHPGVGGIDVGWRLLNRREDVEPLARRDERDARLCHPTRVERVRDERDRVPAPAQRGGDRERR